MAVFCTMAVSSASSGWLFSAKGWEMMNYAAIPFLVLTGMAILWLKTAPKITLPKRSA